MLAIIFALPHNCFSYNNIVQHLTNKNIIVAYSNQRRTMYIL